MTDYVITISMGNTFVPVINLRAIYESPKLRILLERHLNSDNINTYINIPLTNNKFDIKTIITYLNIIDYGVSTIIVNEALIYLLEFLQVSNILKYVCYHINIEPKYKTLILKLKEDSPAFRSAICRSEREGVLSSTTSQLSHSNAYLQDGSIDSSKIDSCYIPEFYAYFLYKNLPISLYKNRLFMTYWMRKNSLVFPFNWTFGNIIVNIIYSYDMYVEYFLNIKNCEQFHNNLLYRIIYKVSFERQPNDRSNAECTVIHSNFVENIKRSSNYIYKCISTSSESRNTISPINRYVFPEEDIPYIRHINGEYDRSFIPIKKSIFLINNNDTIHHQLDISYNDSGKIILIEPLHNNKLHGKVLIHKKDSITEQINYVHGKKHGVSLTYINNGNDKMNIMEDFLGIPVIYDEKLDYQQLLIKLITASCPLVAALSGTIGIPVDICPQINPCSLTFKSPSGGFERRARLKNNVPNKILISVENYIDDMLNGLSINYYNDGIPYQLLTYKNGKKNGIHIEYYDFSKEDKSIYIPQSLRSKCDLLIDVENIIYTSEKTNNSCIKLVQNYVDNMLEGESIYYRETGSIISKSYYKNNSLDGWEYHYDDKGNITRYIYNKDGVAYPINSSNNFNSIF